MSTILSTLSIYFIFVIFFSYILHSFAVFWFQCISDAINMIDQDIIIFVYIFTILSFVKIIYVITPKVSNVFKRIFLCKNCYPLDFFSPQKNCYPCLKIFSLFWSHNSPPAPFYLLTHERYTHTQARQSTDVCGPGKPQI